MLTVERLKELLTYDPETGYFTRNNNTGKFKAGSTSGWTNGLGYYFLSIDGKTYLGHRLVFFLELGDWPKEVDHIDGNPSNNKRSNLRIVTSAQNSWNTVKHKDNTSGYKNVFWSNEHQKYRARFMINGKNIEVGLFDDPKEASEKVSEIRAKYHGEFSRKEN